MLAPGDTVTNAITHYLTKNTVPLNAVTKEVSENLIQTLDRTYTILLVYKKVRSFYLSLLEILCTRETSVCLITGYLKINYNKYMLELVNIFLVTFSIRMHSVHPPKKVIVICWI